MLIIPWNTTPAAVLGFDAAKSDTPDGTPVYVGISGANNEFVIADGSHTLFAINRDVADLTYIEFEFTSAASPNNAFWVGMFPLAGAPYATTPNVISNTAYYRNLDRSYGGGGTSLGPRATQFVNGDVIQLAYDAGKLWIGENNTWDNAGDPVAGTNAPWPTVYTAADMAFFFGSDATGAEWRIRLNNRKEDFTYTAPTGFNALR